MRSGAWRSPLTIWRSSLERNETALQRKVVETTTLYEVGQEIIARITLEPTLHLIVERAHALLQADASMLALRQEGSDTFTMQAHSGTMIEAVYTTPIKPGEGLGGRVVATGMPVIVGDYPDGISRQPLFADRPGIRHALLAGRAAQSP